jgi:hypothetical protein
VFQLITARLDENVSPLWLHWLPVYLNATLQIITGAISMYASFSFFEKAISCPHVWFVMLLSFAYLECWILFYSIGKLE